MKNFTDENPTDYIYRLVGNQQLKIETYNSADTTITPTPISPSDVLSKNSEKNGSWIVVDDNVFDVTEFLFLHPIGKKVIASCCGKDSTREFRYVHKANSMADNWLNAYKIGTLKYPDNLTDEWQEFYKRWLHLAYMFVDNENILLNNLNSFYFEKHFYMISYVVFDMANVYLPVLLKIISEILTGFVAVCQKVCMKNQFSLLAKIQQEFQGEKQKKIVELAKNCYYPHVHENNELQGGKMKERVEEMTEKFERVVLQYQKSLELIKSLFVKGLKILENSGKEVRNVNVLADIILAMLELYEKSVDSTIDIFGEVV